MGEEVIQKTRYKMEISTIGDNDELNTTLAKQIVGCDPPDPDHLSDLRWYKPDRWFYTGEVIRQDRKIALLLTILNLERLSTDVEFYYRDSLGLIIIVAKDNESSLEKIKNWYQDYREEPSRMKNPVNSCGALSVQS